MTEQDEPADLPPSPREDRSGRRSVVLAMLFLIVVGGGSYAITFFFGGATLVVEADKPAAAVLGASAVTLHQVDGEMAYTLRPGAQRVRAGRYRIAVDWEGTELDFSTGSEFTVRRGDELTIRVTGRVPNL
jgi:hypothetical protein